MGFNFTEENTKHTLWQYKFNSETYQYLSEEGYLPGEELDNESLEIIDEYKGFIEE